MADTTLPAVTAEVTTPTLHMADGKPTATSLQVAEHFGKQHKTVLRAIRNLGCSAAFTERNLALSEFVDSTGRRLPMYHITRDGFALLAMGFTGKEAMRWKEAYIAAFNAMEAQLAARTPAPEALLATMAGLMEQMIALQHKTLEVLERLAPKPRTRRTAMADDVLPVKKMHFDGMSYREIHGLTGLSETAIFCIVNDRFEQRPDGRLRLLPNLQIPA